MVDDIDDFFDDELEPSPSLWSRFKDYCGHVKRGIQDPSRRFRKFGTAAPQELKDSCLRIRGGTIELDMEKFSKTPQFKKAIEDVGKLRDHIEKQKGDIKLNVRSHDRMVYNGSEWLSEEQLQDRLRRPPPSPSEMMIDEQVSQLQGMVESEEDKLYRNWKNKKRTRRPPAKK